MDSILDILTLIKTESKEKALSNGAMTVNNIIERLAECDQNKPVIVYLKFEDDTTKFAISDFNGYSWRGSYDLPAVEYTYSDSPSGTVNEVIHNLRKIDGKAVTGYKGGAFLLNNDDVLYFANHGMSGDSIAAIDVEEKLDYVIIYTNCNMY